MDNRIGVGTGRVNSYKAIILNVNSRIFCHPTYVYSATKMQTPIFQLILSNHGRFISNPSAQNETGLQKAITAYHLKRYFGIQKAALAIRLPYSTMKDRIAGLLLRAQARGIQQNPLN